MREIVVRSSKAVVTLASLGVVLMALGLLYWSGMGGTPRVLYGFDYSYLIVFGFFLALGYFPALVSLDANGKRSVKQIYTHLLLLFGVGLLTLIYSLLTPANLRPLDPRHTWFDYYLLGALLIIFVLAAILLSVQDRWRVWKLRFPFLLIFLIGFLVALTGLVAKLDELATLGLMASIGLEVSMWVNFYLYGGILMIFGIFPLLVSGSPGFRDALHKLRFLWLVLVVIGLAIYIVPSLSYSANLDLSIVLQFGYFTFLGYGALFLFLGLLFLSSSRQAHDFIRKFRFLFFLVLLLGIAQMVIAAIQLLPTSAEVAAILGGPILEPAILGMTWDVFFTNGTVMTISALIFLCSILFFETENIGGAIPSPGSALDSLPGVKATPTEILAYLEMVTESNKNLIANFKEAARKDQFRPRVYEALVKQIQTRDEAVQSRLTRFRTKLGDKATSRASVFDSALEERLSPLEDALGKVPEPSTPEPATPPPAATAPSPPSPTAPLPPSPTTPSPPSPTPPPAPTTSIPPASDQSPMDLIADARSTSIAELRGEMLSELRRLREIFKEE